MKKKRTKVFVNSKDVPLIRELARELGFVNPLGTGRYAGEPSQLRLLEKIAQTYQQEPAQLTEALAQLGITEDGGAISDSAPPLTPAAEDNPLGTLDDGQRTAVKRFLRNQLKLGRSETLRSGLEVLLAAVEGAG